MRRALVLVAILALPVIVGGCCRTAPIPEEIELTNEQISAVGSIALLRDRPLTPDEARTLSADLERIRARVTRLATR